MIRGTNTFYRRDAEMRCFPLRLGVSAVIALLSEGALARYEKKKLIACSYDTPLQKLVWQHILKQLAQEY